METNNVNELQDGLESYKLIAGFVQETNKAIDEGDMKLAISYLADIAFITSFAVEHLEQLRKARANAC